MKIGQKIDKASPDRPIIMSAKVLGVCQTEQVVELPKLHDQYHKLMKNTDRPHTLVCAFFCELFGNSGDIFRSFGNRFSASYQISLKNPREK